MRCADVHETLSLFLIKMYMVLQTYIVYWISDGSVVSLKKIVVAVVNTVGVLLKTAVAVVLKLTTAVAVITYNFKLTKNWRKKKMY